MLLESACMPITSSKSRSSQYYIVASSRRRHDYMGINYNGLITKKLAWREKCMKNGTKIDDNHFCGPHDDHWSLSYRPIRIKLSIYAAFDHIYQDMTTVNDFFRELELVIGCWFYVCVGCEQINACAEFYDG